MTTHAVIITYLRDQTQPAVDAIGGFYRTCVLTGKAAGSAALPLA